MILNKLHELERQYKRELSKNFLEYLDSLPPNKRIEQMEILLYKTEYRNLPTLDRRLTFQERKCLYLASQGKEIKETALILGLSQRTIKYHRANIIKKLGVPNFVAAVSRSDLSIIESTNCLPEILMLIPGNIYWKDKKGCYLGCNLFMLNMLGFSSVQQIIGKNDHDLLWKKAAPIIQKNDQKVIGSRKLVRFKENVKLKDGRRIMMISNKMPLLNKSGKIIGVIGSSIDIANFKSID